MVYLHFAGIFREANLWVNGHNATFHEAGYTSFVMRLDNIPGIKFGGVNVVAIYIDPNKGRSGWWYEGSGWHPEPET